MRQVHWHESGSISPLGSVAVPHVEPYAELFWDADRQGTERPAFHPSEVHRQRPQQRTPLVPGSVRRATVVRSAQSGPPRRLSGGRDSRRFAPCPCMAVGGLRTGSCSSLESRLNRCLLGSAGFSPNVSLNAGI